MPNYNFLVAVQFLMRIVGQKELYYVEVTLPVFARNVEVGETCLDGRKLIVPSLIIRVGNVCYIKLF